MIAGEQNRLFFRHMPGNAAVTAIGDTVVDRSDVTVPLAYRIDSMDRRLTPTESR
jgi:hypothetical protein